MNHNTYSVPSRLIGEDVLAHVYDDRVEVIDEILPSLSDKEIRAVSLG